MFYIRYPNLNINFLLIFFNVMINLNLSEKAAFNCEQTGIVH